MFAQSVTGNLAVTWWQSGGMSSWLGIAPLIFIFAVFYFLLILPQQRRQKKWQAMLDTLSIPAFLSWALMIIGVKTWSQRSWFFSTIVVLVPIVLVYGVWSFFTFH